MKNLINAIPDNIMISYIDIDNKSYIGFRLIIMMQTFGKGWEDMEPEEVNMSLNTFLNELVKMNIDDIKNIG